MRTVLLLMLLPVAAQAQTPASSEKPLVDRKAGRPVVFAFDVEPSYYRSILQPVEAGSDEEEKALRVLIEPPATSEWLDGHWNPTVSLCLRPAETSTQSYCVNVDVDRTQGMRTFGSARLFSASGEQMFRKLTPTMFEPHAKVDIKVVRNGEHVITSFNDVTIDEGDVGFTPAFWVIGASTGVAVVEAIEEVEAPLGPGEWPTSIEAAVALELERMSGTSRSTLRGMRKEELAKFRIGWGTQIVERQGLSRGNRTLLDAACGKGCSADDASMVIMEAVWSALQTPPESGETDQR